MSMIGELTFFLGFQVKQMREGIFISQEKYTKDLLKRFNMDEYKPIKTIVIRTGPDIKPVRLSVHWFTGPTVRNRLNHRFNCFGPDELDRPQIL